MNKKIQTPLNAHQLYFLPLGGSSEIGMNLNLYHFDGKWLMVDLGITFANELGLGIMMPDPSFIVDKRRDLLGLVITHGHEDHIGAIPYFWDRLRCPIYATPFTAALVREKLREVGLLEQAMIHEIPLSGTVDLNPFHVEFITLTHSIPEPNALAITTAAGTIIHTGDWKLDEQPLVGKTVDSNRLKALGDAGVIALICDSTNVFVEGKTGSEAQVRTELIEVVKKQRGRVAIACFASNVARLESAAIAARESGRRMALVGRSLHRIYEAARTCGYLEDMPNFIGEDEIKNYPPEQVLMICTGSQGEPRSALTLIASGRHPRVKLYEHDTVIFSSRVIPGNEPAIQLVQDQLIDRGVKVIQDEDEYIHVSGHPSRDDLQTMYKWTRPQIIVPVHGERAHIREHARFACSHGVPMAIEPTNGAIICLDPNDLKVVEEIEVGRLALDGHVLVPRTNAQLRDRHRLMESGIVLVTLMRTAQGKIKDPITITLVGVVEEGAEHTVQKRLKQALMQAYRKAPTDVIRNDQALQELTHIFVRRTMSTLRGKKPTVVTHVLS